MCLPETTASAYLVRRGKTFNGIFKAAVRRVMSLVTQMRRIIVRVFELAFKGKIREGHEGGDRERSHERPPSSGAFIFLRKREIAAFIGIICTALVVVKGAAAVVPYRGIKGEILGEATAGMQALVQAHDAFVRADTDGALRNFLSAQSKFARTTDMIDAIPFNVVVRNMPSVHTALQLVSVGEAASRAAEHVLASLQVLDGARSVFAMSTDRPSESKDSESLLSIPLPPIAEGAHHMRLASEALAQAEAASASLEFNAIPAEYRDALQTLVAVIAPAARLTAKSAIGLELLAGFLGGQQPRRIALIFQNDAELRPTGGFMGSLAFMDVSQGRITAVDAPGGGLYDLKGSLLQRVEAPYPFRLFSPVWQPWNANVFFHFPTSAETLAWFIEKSQGPTVDGMIATTPTMLEDILRLSGPLFLPQYGVVFTQENVRRVLQEEVESREARDRSPKQIIGDLLPGIFTRLSRLLNERPAEFIELVAKALDRKDLLVWSAFPEEQMSIVGAQWGGAVEPGTGDYLAVVHTNVGGGKTDKVIVERWDRVIYFFPDGSAEATLTITRSHHGNPADVWERVHNVDYVRIFVPWGSEFLGASGFESPDPLLFKTATGLDQYPALQEIERDTSEDVVSGVRLTQEHGLEVVGGWLQTPVGETSVATVRYLLPGMMRRRGGTGEAAVHDSRTYTLKIQRQPGAGHVRFTDRIIAPMEWGGYTIRAESQGQLQTEAQDLNLIIDRDTGYGVLWEK